MDDLERLAVRVAAEWQDDPRSGGCPAARWLAGYACAAPRREPDSCHDGVSRPPGGEHPIRWYDDGARVIGFQGERRCYDIPWRAVDAFLRQSLSCDDDELPLEETDALPLAG